MKWRKLPEIISESVGNHSIGYCPGQQHAYWNLSVLNQTMPRENSFDIRVIGDYRSFLNLHESWNALVEKNSHQTVFLNHEWFDAAWQWKKGSDQLRMICAYSDSRLVSVLPLVKSESDSRFGASALRLLDVPDAQECDIVVSDVDSKDAIVASMDQMAKSRDWDIAVFAKLSDSAQLSKYIESASAEAGLRYSKFASGENPGVKLAGSWEEYYRSRSRRLKKGNNLIRNKLHADENLVEVSCIGQGDESGVNYDGVLATIKKISSRSWKADTGVTLDRPGPRDFIERLTRHAAENDWLSIWLLRLNGEYIAFEYQLKVGKEVSALRSDFDPQYSALSPGSYMNWRILESLFTSSDGHYRMGPGDNAYKLRWSNDASKLVEIRLYNATIKGRILWLGSEVLRPILRNGKRITLNMLDRIRRAVETSSSGART